MTSPSAAQAPTTLVTGGASGIGRAIAFALARDGWQVGIVDCDMAAASQVAGEIAAAGGWSEAFCVDVSQYGEWEQLIAQLRSTWPRLDLLVNAAGNLMVGPLATSAPHDMARLVEVNLLGTLFGCRATLPWLMESGSHPSPRVRGVLNIASIFAHVSPPGFATYNATKGAIVSLTESLRGELARHGLGATVVLPGITPTRLFERASYPEGAWRELCERYVAGAELSADRVASEAIAALAAGRLYAVVGGRAKRYAWLKRLAPAWLIDRVAQKAATESPTSTPSTEQNSPALRLTSPATKPT